MVLRSGRKHVHSTGSQEMSGQTGEESDPEYRSGDEGGSQDNGSESSASEKVSSSSNDHMKGELWSKKRHDVQCEGQREVGHRKGHRCALDAICALNDQLSYIQKKAIRGMNPKSKYFKLGRREVPFSHFDAALLTGFSATGKRIAFERSNGGNQVEQVLKGAMEEHVCRERQRRRTGQKDMRIYRNYVSVLIELFRVSNTVERVTMFKKLYTFLVVSGLLFPRGAGDAAWDLVHVVEEVDRVGEYNWAEAGARDGGKPGEDGEHEELANQWVCDNPPDERKVPRLSSWVNLYKGKKYDAGVVVRKLKDSEGVISMEERLQRVRDALKKERDALAKEREVHATMKKELAELKEAVVMKTAVEDILEFGRPQGLHSTEDAPEKPTADEEGTNTDIFTLDMGGEADQASPSSPV
ncbi:hypothetical protein Cgig2_006578 [Carnegiea gigantea]|uniref:Uncharacterized protein n=1 Tax=Carnegiea gigantea TaxID=171969 RepID=A0A9Q1KPY4_9CARY|nr:hypothetical protein Cgig2_006578 [Carnegiea gigantea]